MTTEFKIQISKATYFTLCLLACLFVIGVFILVICAGIGINPFRPATTELLAAGFVGLIGLSAVMFLLNVASNIGLIAESRLSDSQLGGGRQSWRI